MTLRIIWRVPARDDLLELYDWIARHAGSETAYEYTAAIEAYAAKPAGLPERGAPRDELAPGIRTIAYRRRTTIAYRILPDAIEVVRLAHGGRDLGRVFDEDAE
ncbi:type II toxin-antitoxin system RelE/ParE family toxin [Sphingomonas sp.]|uniref:type II toxin-antitoxin system RelE/ParE family toxin n=1 Tax=Sphingomonas sp. TaxID=28214 RepID=UPI003AFF6C1A